MKNTYTIHCQCGAVELQLDGSPVVHAFCHCTDCRELLDTPYHAVTAWLPGQVTITSGENALEYFQHPELEMQRVFCKHCGETLFNTNVMDWRVVSQWLISKCNDGVLPAPLTSDKHFFYEQRVVDVSDELPKYMRGTDGPMFEQQG